MPVGLLRCRRDFVGGLCSFVLCVGFLASCSADKSVTGLASRASSSAGAAAFSDVDLLRGLVFADGPVAEFLPAIRDHLSLSPELVDSGQLVAARALFLETARSVADRDPLFMKQFGREVRSGDPIRIRAAMSDGVRRVTAELFKRPAVVEARTKLQRDTTAMRQMRQRVQELSASAAKASTTASDSARVRSLFDNTLLLISDSGDPAPDFFSIFFGFFIVAYVAVFEALAIVGGVIVWDGAAIWSVLEYTRVIDREVDFFREDPAMKGSGPRENILMDRVVGEAAQLLKA